MLEFHYGLLCQNNHFEIKNIPEKNNTAVTILIVILKITKRSKKIQ